MTPTIQPTTKVVGLIGHPIEHSYSPLIHNAAFEESGLDFLYLTFDVHPGSLKEGIRGLAALNIAGVNVTIPHKERVLELLDVLSPEARVIGAVNTIVNDGFKLHGYNTDAFGFLASLRPYADRIRGETVAVLGAGGASRAVLYALITEVKPKHVYLLNRHLERAESLRIYLQKTLSFSAVTTQELFDLNAIDSLANSRLLVNTTAVGMYPNEDESPVVTDKVFDAGQILVDLVYNPPVTKLIRMAEGKGATVVGGWEMLLQQAAKSFELWTDTPMPVEKVRSALRDRVPTVSLKG